MTSDEAKRIGDLERDVRDRIVQIVVFPVGDNECIYALTAAGEVHSGWWQNNQFEWRLHLPPIAARLAEPRASTATDPVEFVPWKYADEPSEDDLRELAAELLFVHKEERAWTKEDCHRFIRDNPNQPEAVRLLKRARIAWRWCRERMVAAPPQPAPTVPAEILHDLPVSRPITDEEFGAVRRLLAWLRSQPTPAPDPEAVELAKRLPPADQLQWFIPEGDLKAFPHRKYRQALSDAAAFVRRAAGEPGV